MLVLGAKLDKLEHGLTTPPLDGENDDVVGRRLCTLTDVNKVLHNTPTQKDCDQNKEGSHLVSIDVNMFSVLV